MKAEDVAQYLQNHPQFFEDHVEMLSEINLPHPYGGRTISLSERQLLAMREKNKELERQLNELVEFARNNDALQEKVHRFTLSLFSSTDLMALQDLVMRGLRETFNIPHAEMRIWKGMPPSTDVLSFCDQQKQPACTHHALHDTAEWFGEAAEHLRSFAYLPLHDGENSIGLLILASEDAQRFYPEMGTLFLQRIAETVSTALLPRL